MTSISFPGASSQAYTKLNVGEAAKFQKPFSSTAKGEIGVDDSVDISDRAWEASAKIATLKGFVDENGQTFKVYEFKSGEIRKELVPQQGFSQEALDEMRTWATANGRNISSSDEIGLFSGSHNPYTNLGTMLGLEGKFSDRDTFLSSLNNLISRENKALTSDLSNVLKKAGLEDVTKKITFAEDAKGNIVIEGNISTRQKTKLAKLVNSDTELVERIKTQKARMEIAGELERGETNLAHEKFDVARTQILKDYLDKNGIPLDDVRLEDHESGLKNFALRDDNGNRKEGGETLDDLLNNTFPELGREILAYTERKNATQTRAVSLGIDAATNKDDSTSVRSLLSMKRGVLYEESGAGRNIDSQIQSLFDNVSSKIVAEVNRMFEETLSDEDSKISDYNIKVDSTGRVKISDVRTIGNDPIANANAEKLMNGMMDSELRKTANNIGSAILEFHDEEHGDVVEYTHEVTLKSGSKTDYEITSPEADEAALREIKTLTNEIGSFLNDFFKATLDISGSFNLVFDDKSLQLFDAGTLSPKDAVVVKNVLADLNKYIAGDDTVDESDDTLPSKYGNVGDKLIALKEAHAKLHDKSLIPKKGVHFSFSS